MLRIDVLSKQLEHIMCGRFGRPHEVQGTTLSISLSALPVNCRVRFLEYELFFFGTALRIESQIPAIQDPTSENDVPRIGNAAAAIRMG